MSVQASHVHGGAIRSGRTPLANGELEVEGRGPLATLTFLGIWGFEMVRECDSDLGEGIRRLGPAPATLVSIAWVSSSESSVRSMTLLSTLSLAALAASL
jgi:hypothetical protein